MINRLLIIIVLLSFCFSQDCETGYSEVNGLCFHDGDIGVLQKMINNSYESGIDLGCADGDNYCGSPNPYMDSGDNWMWVVFDSLAYEWPGDENGRVDPLELGVQEWNNGRLTSLMCGAYIYCQLSGPIPEEINQLTEINTLRLEYNYLSGFVPEEVCDLTVDNDDYLAFDLSGNHLCPPYPDCIGTDGFWYQDVSGCTEIGDVNFDFTINIQDIINLVSFIMNLNLQDNQEAIASDINMDGVLDVLDVVAMVDYILNGS